MSAGKLTQRTNQNVIPFYEILDIIDTDVTSGFILFSTRTSYKGSESL